MRSVVRPSLLAMLLWTALPAQAAPPPVSFFFQAGDIWHFAFLLAHPEAVREIRFRSKSDGVWSSAARTVDSGTHKPSPVISVSLPLSWARPGRQKIEIALVDKAGKVAGPYFLELDLEAEAVATAKEWLGDALTDWAGFGDREGWRESLLFFHEPLRLHDALREIRYSLDGCGLDRRIPLHSKPGFGGPEWTGEDFLRIPKSVAYACAQLVFRDGTTLGPLRIEHRTGPEPPRDPAPCRHFAKSGSPPPPPAPAGPVTLSPWRAHGGWILQLGLANPEAVQEIRYRLDGAAWTSTGTTRRMSPHTGRYYPKDRISLRRPLVTPGRHALQIELVGLDGKPTGPYTLSFDPARQILADAKTYLNEQKDHWASLEDRNGRILFSLGVPFGVKDVLREMRYSFDGCALDRRFPFQPWNDLSELPSSHEDTHLWLPAGTKASSVCVQLIYCDGAVAGPRSFSVRPFP